MYNTLEEKKIVFDEMGKAISKALPNIVSIELDILKTEDEGTYEYIVVTFRGGAISVRNASINSMSANLAEISKLVNGGYYKEVETYKNLKEKINKLNESVLKENTLTESFQDIAAAVEDVAGWLGEIQIDNAGEIIQILIAERDDKLDPRDVNKILSSGNTWDAFYDLVADVENNSWDWFHDTKEEVIRSVMEEYPELDEDFLLDNLYVNYDTENLLNQEYPMFFNINTGDGNYSYTLNPNYSMDKEEIKDLSNEASVVWLAGTQGYSREDVVGAILNRDYKGSKFLKSLRQEYIDTASQMNSIIFLGTMSLKDMMDSKETGSIKVPTNTVLGFWDGWSGTGSTIGIELEKPVVVPYEIRDRIYAAYGKTNDVYTPQEIYGLISKVYDVDFILEAGLSKNE